MLETRFSIQYYICMISVTLASVGSLAPRANAELRIGAVYPLTGIQGWSGDKSKTIVDIAVQEINQSGGLLGQSVDAIVVDDHCDAEQAVAAARKLISDGVDVVIGHGCSGAAIPASKVYEEAGIIYIASTASNPLLPDQGHRHTFRMAGRDTLQGEIVGDYLASNWANKKIAILHDDQAYGRGLARATKKFLNQSGVVATVFDEIAWGRSDYHFVLTRLGAAEVDVLFLSAYQNAAGIFVRQARDLGYKWTILGSDALAIGDFQHIAGLAAQGVRFVSLADPRRSDEAQSIVRKYKELGVELELFPLYNYGAIQAWGQAVERVGTVSSEVVAAELRSGKFETVFGKIGFDQSGDSYGYKPFAWYIWKENGYILLEEKFHTE